LNPVTSIHVPWDPEGLTLIPATGAILVLGDAGGAVFDPRTGSVSLISSAVISGLPSFVGEDGLPLAVYDPADGLVFDDTGYGINVVNPATWSLVTHLSVSAQSVAYDPTSQQVYFASPYTWAAGVPPASSLMAVNGSTFDVENVAALGVNSQGVCVDATTGWVYVANEGSANLSVFNPSSGELEPSIAAGINPWDCIVDDASHSVYVSGYNFDGGYN
ncbi:surface antigen-like protein, partial [mine drainage metagenome]